MIKNISLETIIKELYQISGFRISIYDTNQQELYAWPKELSPFCSLLQRNEQCLANCRKADRQAFATVKEHGEVLIYRCYAGLYEAVAPLYDHEEVSGYLMMGQTLDTMKQSRQEVYQKAAPLVDVQEELLAAVAQIPDRSKQQILSCISIMEICAAYISLSRRMKAAKGSLAAQVRDYLREHYLQDQSLDHLCQRFYCSRANLTTAFRTEYGTSIHQYLITVRLENSRLLLDNESFSINQAALKSGFRDQNYYTKVFKKKYGITPSEYRRSFCAVPGTP